MKRKLFCEICPFTYRLSMEKEILKRHVKDFLHKTRFARERTEDSLPVLVYQHKSLIRRRLGNVNMQLQENKATNLALAVTHIDGLLIRPGEVFSVWKLVGRTTKQKGYKEGLTIRAAELQPHTFHIHAENEHFSREDGIIYRNGQVYRDIIDRVSSQHLESQLIRTNHAKVMYDLEQKV